MAKIDKQIFLDNLPIGGLNRGNRINWKDSCGCKVRFIYGDIEGYINIIKYNQKTSKLLIKYKEKESTISISAFEQCKIGNILKIHTSEFKYEIGQIFKDDKRDITITDREYKYRVSNNKRKEKYYKYTCNTCGWTEGWILEGNLIKQGCGCCSGHILVEGINSIVDTDKWMIPYFQGGYDEAKLYTYGTNQKIYPICPDCGRVKGNKIQISNIHKHHSIGCDCGDKIPYPEKLMFSVLEQLGLDFQTQLNKTNFDWCGKYKYDFYFELNRKQYIIETHGEQHYTNSFSRIVGANSLEQEQANDKLKKELALSNGILEENYIIINCRKSVLEWIKEHILKSDLVKILDLNQIDWLKAEEFSVSNLAKIACEYKKNNSEMTTTEIGKIMRMHPTSIIKYLKKGNELGWCVYDSKQELIKSIRNNGKNNGKQVEMFKNNISLGIFPSAHELERKSEKLFNVKLIFQGISMVCSGKAKQYKGYTFTYSSNL